MVETRGTESITTAAREDTPRAQALLASDQSYFSAGANTVVFAGGQLSISNGFEKLSGGCVLHSIDPSALRHDPTAWVAKVNARFQSAGATMVRFYLSQPADDLTPTLRDLGLSDTIEVGYVAAASPPVAQPDITLLEITDASGEAAKQAILASDPIHGPDGHRLDPATYIAFEMTKVHAGYMRCYLGMSGDHAVAAIGIARVGEFWRLKNLIVHAQHRGRGVGRQMLAACQAEAHAHGARWVGAYALACSKASGMYPRNGFSAVTAQAEWTRPL